MQFKNLASHSTSNKDLMARKPRNARTERLTDWRFFFQIYLVRFLFHNILRDKIIYLFRTVHGLDDVALRDEHVVPLHVRTRSSVL